METKQYKNNSDLIVTWTPSKCIHAGICVKTLPDVYHPKEQPWLRPEHADKKALMAQIDNCPSGALGYILPGTGDEETPDK